MKKIMLRVIAWLLAVAMMLPSVGSTLTARAEEGKVAHKGSVSFSDTAWWTEYEMTTMDLLGSVDPGQVAYVRFYSDTTFGIGYSDTNGGWSDERGSKELFADDILFTAGSVFKFSLSKGDGVKYTINWEVITGDVKMPESTKPATGNADAAYTGDYTEGGKASYEDLAKTKGDVTVTVSFDRISVEPENGYQFATFEPITGWPKLTASEYVKSDIPINEWDFIKLDDPSVSSVSFTVAESTIKRLVDGGNYLGILVYGVVITDVQVKSAPAKPTNTPTPTPTPEPTPEPVKYTTIGDKLVVTESMVKNGSLVIKNEKWNEIVIPDGLKIERVQLSNVSVDTLIVTGGRNYDVSIKNSEIGSMDVVNPEIEEISYEKLEAMFAELRKLEDDKAFSEGVNNVVAIYKNYLLVKATVAESKVKISADKWTTIENIELNTNTNLNVTEATAEVISIVPNGNNERLRIDITGFDGKIDITDEKDAGRGFVNLELKNSTVASLTATGNDDCYSITSNNSAIDTMTVSGVSDISLLTDVTTLVVDEKTENADIRVYSEIDSVEVKGNKNDIVLPSCGKIGNATVEGDTVRIYGIGTLESAQITGKGANVAVYGTEVEGENDTTIPAAMEAMMPPKKPAPPVNPDAAYVGDYGSIAYRITVEDLKKQTGDVTIKVKYRTLSENAVNASGQKYGWWQYQLCEEASGGWVSLGPDSFEGKTTIVNDGWFNLSKTAAGESKYSTFVLKESVVQRLIANDNDLIFQVYGVIVEDAQVGYVKNPDDDYVGDWNSDRTISASEFKGYIGNVTLDVTYRKYTPATSLNIAFYQALDAGWQFLTNSAFAELNGYTVGATNNIELESGSTSISLVLKAETVQDILKNNKGLGIQVNGIIIESATLSGEKTENPPVVNPPVVNPDDGNEGGNTGDNTGSATIHTFTYDDFASRGDSTLQTALKLSKYGITEIATQDKVKVTVVLDSDGYYKVNLAGNAYDADTVANPYGKWTDFQLKEATAEEVVLETVYEVPGNNPDYLEVMVQVHWMDAATKEVIIKSVKMEKVTTEQESPKPEDTTSEQDKGYKGDYSGYYEISSDELSALSGKVKLEVTYHTLSAAAVDEKDGKPYTYYQYNVNLVDVANGGKWTTLKPENYASESSSGVNQYGSIDVTKSDTAKVSTVFFNVDDLKDMATGDDIKLALQVYGVIIEDIKLTKVTEDTKPEYTGSVTLPGTNYWSSQKVELATFFNGIDPSNVEKIVFTSDSEFILQYNSTTKQGNDGGAYETGKMSSLDMPIEELNVAGFYLQINVSYDDGKEHTVYWTVVEKDS